MEEIKTEGLAGAGDHKTPERLTGIGELFQRSWHLYRMRFHAFSLIYLFYLVPQMLISGFCFYVYKMSPHPLNPFLTAWIASGVIIGVLISVWGQAAFVYAVSDPSAGIRVIFQKAAESLRKFVWIYLLFFALTIAGFVLFVVPGIIMMVWFSFSVFILAGTGETGINALLESRQYVKGLWWPVFMRLLAVWALSFGLASLPVVGTLLFLFFMPYLITYTSQLYKELAGLKGVISKPSDRDRKKWAVIAVFAFIVSVSVFTYTVKNADLKALWLQESGGGPAPAAKPPASKPIEKPIPPAVAPPATSGSLRSI